MRDKNFAIEIRTPEKLVFQGDVDSVKAPGIDGNFQILIDHLPFLTVLKPGELKIEDRLMFVSSGVFEVLRTGVTVLADAAEWSNEIDSDRAENSLRRAKNRIASNEPDLDLIRAESSLLRAEERLRIADRQ